MRPQRPLARTRDSAGPPNAGSRHHLRSLLDDEGGDFLGEDAPATELARFDDELIWRAAASAARARDWEEVRRQLLRLEHTPAAVVGALGRLSEPAPLPEDRVALAFVRGEAVEVLRAVIDRDDADDDDVTRGLFEQFVRSTRWAAFELALAVIDRRRRR